MRRIHLSEGLIIASVPVLAYLYSYLYNFGYGTYFGLPGDLVSFSLPNLFSTLLALVVASTALVYMLTMISTRKKKTTDKSEVLVSNVLAMVGVFMAAVVLSAPGRLLLFMGLAIGFLVFLHMLAPIVSQRSSGSYPNRLAAHIEKAEKGESTAMDVLYKLPLKPYFGYVIFLMASLLLTGCLGFYNAHGQSLFYVEKQDPNWVAVRFLDDRAVMVHRKANQLTGEFKLIPLDQNGVTPVLQRLDVGHLTRSK